MTGFDLLLSLGERIDFKTIFVTAHDQHAIKAMRLKAIDYLLKPIDPDELVAAVESFKNLHPISKAISIEPIKLALPGLSESPIVSSKDIVFIAAQKNYSDVHLANGQKHTISRTLNVFEMSLEKAGFLRIHRGFLINIEYVQSLSKTDGGGVVMNSGDFIPMGKSRRESALQVLQKHFSFV